MALQTQQALLAADQEHAIDASVRRVARRAAFHFYGRVLEDKGSTLLGVTLGAGFPAALAERGPVRSAVGIVAVSTIHRAFRNTMVRGQSELRLNVAVTSVAQFRLRLDELAIVQPAGLFRQLRHIEEVPLRRA